MSQSRLFFFFNDTATTEIYTLSLHDALPISADWRDRAAPLGVASRQRRAENRAERKGEHLLRHAVRQVRPETAVTADRKSTRLNSSHANISYAVFCLKKKKTKLNIHVNVLAL